MTTVALPPPAAPTADAIFEAELRAATEAPLRRPGATYRVQMNKGFRFDDLAAIVDYLADLGVTDCYMSPYLQARPGSTHGYDVFDHTRINAEIGDEPAHARLVARLRHRGMGRVVDVVPNHMGIGGPNPFWLEVLETGPQAPAARFFDIDWKPVKDELEGRVLLPILEDQYGKVLEAGLLTLEREGGAFFIRYHAGRYPVAPRSYARILERGAEMVLARLAPDDPLVLEYRSVWGAAHHLPDRNANDPEQVEQKIREKEVIKRRLERLCADSAELREILDLSVASFRGTAGVPSSFDGLHELLEEQVYRLAYWRVAAEEINYRRFFDINDLAGIRTEDPFVFDVSHRRILAWVDEGGVTALRIDHPDGLADPHGYFRRLQESLFLRGCQRRIEEEHPEAEWRVLADPLRRRFRELAEQDPASALARRFPVIVEKILSRGEELPDDWSVDGTVGYEFLNVVNGLFVANEASEAVDAVYAEFTGDREPFAEVLYQSKEQIARASMASEINMLARQLNRVSEEDRRSRDFTLNDLRRAVRETIACFPVYRTYVRPGRPVSGRDRGYIDQAVARARRRNPNIDVSVFAFLRDILLLEDPPGTTPAGRALREEFVERFQQTTGPVQAKGLEDTAFYRHVPLASLNEVGADPARFGHSVSVFHALCSERLKRWPGSFGATATHDTKRGEDARIRINVIAELVDEWKLHLARWSRSNARKKVAVGERVAPDAREEYLFYQTLIGAWPFGGGDDALSEEFFARIQRYVVKAAREAKLNTSWTEPDQSYAEALEKFVADVLAGDDTAPFLKDFAPFARRIARVGVVHSLAQTLLKLTAPGVPDVYQGCELWDLSLVDPDNRRPVDYGLRSRLLGGMRDELAAGSNRAEVARDLFANPDDGAIKLYLTWTVLNHRKLDPELYAQGSYRPVEVEGERRNNVLGFARSSEARSVVTLAPRLVAGLMTGDTPPLGPTVWGDTRVVLPDGIGSGQWRELLTGVPIADRGGIMVSELFQVLPVALLVSTEH
jgi:(1->4)-alpha-D-glucan 1-alpha-D-glucosylmutase